MELMKTAAAPSTRLSRGNVLIANAQTVNLKPLKARFDAFVGIHQRYIEAHDKVGEAEALERTKSRRVEQLDGVQVRAIDALSAALLVDGQQRRNPFARFSDRGPGQICTLPVAEKAKAVQKLVANLRRGSGLSKATLDAATRAEQAALKVNQALIRWELRRTHLVVVRKTRDSMEAKWDTAYTALRRLTQSVVEDGDLYAALFPRSKRSSKKAGPSNPAEPRQPAGNTNVPASPPTSQAA